MNRVEYTRNYAKERRAEAKANGICIYCKTRPATEEKVSCAECREYDKQYKAEHRTEIREQRRSHYIANRERLLETKKQWHKANRDKRSKYMKEYSAIKRAKDICCCYAIDIVGFRYIGETYGLKKRILNHLSDLRLGKHDNKALQALYNAHGPDTLQFKQLIVLDKTSTKDYLRKLESYYINQTDKKICLNF